MQQREKRLLCIKATACEAARGAIAGEGAGIGEWGVLGSVVAGVGRGEGSSCDGARRLESIEVLTAGWCIGDGKVGDG